MNQLVNENCLNEDKPILLKYLHRDILIPGHQAVYGDRFFQRIGRKFHCFPKKLRLFLSRIRNFRQYTL